MILALGMALDALAGEPRLLWSRLPHPAVLMGRVIGWADQRFNKGTGRRATGVGVMASLVLAAGGLGVCLQALPGPVVDIIVVAILLAQKSLVQHVARVADGLRMSLAEGRRAVAMIVSRDTADMTPPQIARSAIESAAENLSDGVIAPIFWFAIGGLPGLLVYKITNTADSMIGYLTPRHKDFGWAAARFDDLLNLAPARLTAALIALVTPQSDVPGIRRDAPRHRSPNAGWPEAAMAYGHGIALAGPRSYDGVMTDFPFVNPAGRKDLGPDDIDAVVGTLWRVWAATFGAVVLVGLVGFF